MRISRQLLSALLFHLLIGAGWLMAQSPSSAPGAASGGGSEDYPEHAYLSPSRYVNQYFNFSFDLPADPQVRAVPQPVSRDGTIQLLEMGGPPPVDAEISISAVPTAGGTKQDAKALMRYMLDQELYRGVEELRGLSKASIAGHQFFLFETRRGVDQHIVLATTLDDYILRVVLAAHDEKAVKRLETAFDHIVFFPAADLQKYISADARSYDGPSISSHRLAALEADPPAKHIDPGKIQGDFYENASIGFSYRIPQGWVLEENGAVIPAIERYRAKEDFGRPRIGRTEHRLMEACSRTLFSVWAKRSAADGQISYDDFGEVTVSAIALACFPRMKFPSNSSDERAAKDFLLQFALTNPIIEDMRDGKAFTAGGNVFLFLRGTVGFQVANDELSRRLSIAMAITERRGYLLTWFFAAPHDEELQALTNERVSFDSAPAASIANATQPGGAADAAGNAPATPAHSSTANTPTATGGASATTNTPPAAETGATAAVTSSNSVPPAQPASASTNSPSSDTSNSPNATGDSAESTPGADADRPTLLRPGESVQTQQGKGAPIPKQK
jgi:hypothetical protein